jgi:hypothetical protein
MDQKFQRIFLRRIESRRLDHETLHLVVIRALECERLQRLHVDLRQQRVVDVRDLFWFTLLICKTPNSLSPNLGRRRREISRVVKRFWADAKLVEMACAINLCRNTPAVSSMGWNRAAFHRLQ